LTETDSYTHQQKVVNLSSHITRSGMRKYIRLLLTDQLSDSHPSRPIETLHIHFAIGPTRAELDSRNTRHAYINERTIF